MRKTQAEYNREHSARLRRKAKAFDQVLEYLRIMKSLSSEPTVDPVRAYPILDMAIAHAEKAVRE